MLKTVPNIQAMHLTSGTVLMLTTSALHCLHNLLSARVENRGPSMVIIVPLSRKENPRDVMLNARSYRMRTIKNIGKIFSMK